MMTQKLLKVRKTLNGLNFKTMKKYICFSFLAAFIIFFVSFLYVYKKADVRTVRIKNFNYSQGQLNSGATILADAYDINSDTLVCNQCKISHETVTTMLLTKQDIITLDVSDNSTSIIFICLLITVSLLFGLFFALNQVTNV